VGLFCNKHISERTNDELVFALGNSKAEKVKNNALAELRRRARVGDFPREKLVSILNVMEPQKCSR